MDLGLTGRVALVAAASKGLGKAVAMALAREGCKLAICSRDGDAIRLAAEEIQSSTGAEVLAAKADVTVPQELESLVARTLERFDKVDILVTNAGGPPPGNFDDFGDDAWEKAFRLNFLSAVRLIRLCLPSMRQQRWGRIILLTSLAVKQPFEGLILSNAVRTGVVGLAKSLSFELAKDNILVNCVAPGRIATERVQQLDEARAAKEGRSAEEVRRENERAIPLGRYGQPEEFASVVAFLASERASYLTGVTLQVDGGMYRGTM
jgi:3-oxoacyl-[acyl-carrier protein] reductase